MRKNVQGMPGNYDKKKRLGRRVLPLRYERMGGEPKEKTRARIQVDGFSLVRSGEEGEE